MAAVQKGMPVEVEAEAQAVTAPEGAAVVQCTPVEAAGWAQEIPVQEEAVVGM